MRRFVIAATVMGLLVAPAGSALAAGTVAPALRVIRLHPFTVQGAHFKAGERVIVTLVSGKRWAARGTANARGTFTVALPAASLTTCNAYSVRATGTRGSSALFKAPGCTASGKPSAAVSFEQIVTIKGAHFKPGEHLTVTLAGQQQTWTRQAQASAGGSFLVDLGALSLNSCSPYTLAVAGTLGSRFAFVHPQVPC